MPPMLSTRKPAYPYVRMPFHIEMPDHSLPYGKYACASAETGVQVGWPVGQSRSLRRKWRSGVYATPSSEARPPSLCPGSGSESDMGENRWSITVPGGRKHAAPGTCAVKLLLIINLL